jgi:hypothetical protein
MIASRRNVMADEVSRSEWKRRRKELDKKLVDDDAKVKQYSTMKSGDDPRLGSDALLRKQIDENYKKTYRKELGYAPEGKGVTKKRTSKSTKSGKKVSAKK